MFYTNCTVIYESFTYVLCSTVAEYDNNIDYVVQFSISLHHKAVIDTYGRGLRWVGFK